MASNPIAAQSSSPPTAKHFRLTGPSPALDRRVNAARGDIAAVALADRVFAPHYARPLPHGCAVTATPLLEAPHAAARAVSELLLGEGFAVVDVSGNWAWGYAMADHYVGYVPLDALGPLAAPTHIVSAMAALVFADADFKAPVRARLPMGARLRGVEAGDFLTLDDGGHVHLRHVRPAAQAEADPVAVAERLIGAPYRWGGRSGDGLDCSGLVQIALAACGIAAPRDSDQQQALGTMIGADVPLMRGDLVFWPGHVGMMADDAVLVHANAHWMMTVREPLADVIARNPLPISARRRLA